jgi:hypothetical protein
MGSVSEDLRQDPSRMNNPKYVEKHFGLPESINYYPLTHGVLIRRAQTVAVGKRRLHQTPLDAQLIGRNEEYQWFSC